MTDEIGYDGSQTSVLVKGTIHFVSSQVVLSFDGKDEISMQDAKTGKHLGTLFLWGERSTKGADSPVIRRVRK